MMKVEPGASPERSFELKAEGRGRAVAQAEPTPHTQGQRWESAGVPRK